MTGSNEVHMGVDSAWAELLERLEPEIVKLNVKYIYFSQLENIWH